MAKILEKVKEQINSKDKWCQKKLNDGDKVCLLGAFDKAYASQIDIEQFDIEPGIDSGGYRK